MRAFAPTEHLGWSGPLQSPGFSFQSKISVSRRWDTTFRHKVLSRVGETIVWISRNVFLTFWGMSHAKRSVLKAFLTGPYPKTSPKPIVSCETSLKKSKKHCARALSDQLLIIYAPKTIKNALISLSRGSSGSGVSSFKSDPSPTRAGGQDDGS